MRVKEWYGWHFPELAKIENDNLTYAKLVLFIKDKATLSQDKLHDLAALVNEDSGLAERIIEAARISMGQDISETDMDNIVTFAQRVANITEYRKRLFDYLSEKMHTVAPNLSELIGEVVGARLISHAGSLTNLSKYPASTVQILGAEKALSVPLRPRATPPSTVSSTTLLSLARLVPRTRAGYPVSLLTSALLLLVLTITQKPPPTSLVRFSSARSRNVLSTLTLVSPQSRTLRL